MPSPKGSTNSIPLALIDEGERAMRICNACRYCEGFCAVFPAMERRLEFEEKDLSYLANLCHDCAECYYSCQYAPPHELALNLPQTLAEIRRESYRKYAWPDWCAALFRWNRLALILGALERFQLCYIARRGRKGMARGFPTPKGKGTAMPQAAHPQGFKPLRPNRVTARLKPCPYPKFYIPSVKML